MCFQSQYYYRYRTPQTFRLTQNWCNLEKHCNLSKSPEAHSTQTSIRQLGIDVDMVVSVDDNQTSNQTPRTKIKRKDKYRKILGKPKTPL